MRFHFILFSLLMSLSVSRVVRSEVPPDFSGDFTELIELIEELIPTDGTLPIPGTFPLYGCMITVVPGYPTVTIYIARTLTCPVAGTIMVGGMPMRASVHLDVYGMPPVEGIDFDMTATIVLEGEAVIVTWDLKNGSLTVRPIPGMPVQEFLLVGHGQRAQSSETLKGNSRINVFLKETSAGFALLRSVSRQKPDPIEHEVEVCKLSDADPEDVEAGTLTDCRGRK